MVMYGRDAFERRHAETLATFCKGTVKSHVIRRLTPVSADAGRLDLLVVLGQRTACASGIERMSRPKDGVALLRGPCLPISCYADPGVSGGSLTTSIVAVVTDVLTRFIVTDSWTHFCRSRWIRNGGGRAHQNTL